MARGPYVKRSAEDLRARSVARREAKIVYNKAAIDALYAGMADGLIELGERIIADASERAPKDAAAAAARGVPMLKDTGFISVWGQGKLVHGSAQVAASKNKPRGVRTPKDQVVLVAGFSSPIAHLQELGTVKMTANPFLTPALMANIANAGPYVTGAMSRYTATAGVRAERGAGINAARAAAAAARAEGIG
jgi:hypothetical protein